jgi:hypothetical protein
MMMMPIDFRPADTVRFRRGLKEKSLEKIKAFLVARETSEARQKWVLDAIKIGDKKLVPFRVVECYETKKTKTPYVRLSYGSNQFLIQSRYLKLIGRKPKHLLTDMFLPDFK